MNQNYTIVIVTPALADANNGNWQTAQRWAKQLSTQHTTRIVAHWDPASDPRCRSDQVMIALHARRSAASIAAWHERHRQAGLIVAMTGTDLYRDIQTDQSAQCSMDLAQRLVVLQECGLSRIPEQHRPKTQVIFQSTSARASPPKAKRHFNAVMVGHLRAEKSPETFFQAAQLLRNHAGIHLMHIGHSLDPVLGQQALQTQVLYPQYRWLQGLPYAQTRRKIAAAHVLVHTSKMEGGAHVVMEAVCSGTPVIASRIEGNIGMLGTEYEGYFEWGRADELAQVLLRCKQNHAFLDRLKSQCAARAMLFAPQAEQKAWLELVNAVIPAPI